MKTGTESGRQCKPSLFASSVDDTHTHTRRAQSAPPGGLQYNHYLHWLSAALSPGALEGLVEQLAWQQWWCA